MTKVLSKEQNSPRVLRNKSTVCTTFFAMLDTGLYPQTTMLVHVLCYIHLCPSSLESGEVCCYAFPVRVSYLYAYFNVVLCMSMLPDILVYVIMLIG